MKAISDVAALRLLSAVVTSQEVLAQWVLPHSKLTDKKALQELLAILDDGKLVETIRSLTLEPKEEILLEKEWPESHNVAKTKFIPENETLEVTFKNNHSYRYDKFPREKWLELINAPSIGSYLNRNIKGQHSFVQIS